MSDFKQRYLTVTMDQQQDGFAIQAWMSPERPHPMDLMAYPHVYTYLGENCTWFIYSSSEMTPKLIMTCGEQADRICAANIRVLNKRVAVNSK